MAVFKDTQAMYDVLGGLFNQLLEDSEFAAKFADANLSIKFQINDPEGMICIKPGEVICGEAPDFKANITMDLSGDTCHKFWLKKVNLPIALAKRQIKAKGPINKVLKMLPMLKPAYELYPKICDDKGLPKV
jgi:putative sterol carrier protein